MGDKKIAEFNFGPHGHCLFELKDGNVQATVKYDSPHLSSVNTIIVKTKAGLEELKQLIPGSIDDAIINVVESFLGL